MSSSTLSNHPFRRDFERETTEDAAAERRLSRLPFALQTRCVGDDWVTLARGNNADCLMGIAAVFDARERRLLNRNTITASWATGEKVGQQ